MSLLDQKQILAMFKEEIFLRFPSNCKTEQREALVTKAFYARFFLYILQI